MKRFAQGVLQDYHKPATRLMARSGSCEHMLCSLIKYDIHKIYINWLSRVAQDNTAKTIDVQIYKD